MKKEQQPEAVSQSPIMNKSGGLTFDHPTSAARVCRPTDEADGAQTDNVTVAVRSEPRTAVGDGTKSKTRRRPTGNSTQIFTHRSHLAVAGASARASTEHKTRLSCGRASVRCRLVAPCSLSVERIDDRLPPSVARRDAVSMFIFL